MRTSSGSIGYLHDSAGACDTADDLTRGCSDLNELSFSRVIQSLSFAADGEPGTAGHRLDILTELYCPRFDQLIAAQRLAGGNADLDRLADGLAGVKENAGGERSQVAGSAKEVSLAESLSDAQRTGCNKIVRVHADPGLEVDGPGCRAEAADADCCSSPRGASLRKEGVVCLAFRELGTRVKWGDSEADFAGQASSVRPQKIINGAIERRLPRLCDDERGR